MKLQKVISFIFLGLLTIVLAACGNGSKEVNDSTAKGNNGLKTVNIGYFPMVDETAILKQQGWLDEALKEKGVNINWVSVQSGREVNTAISAGSLDFTVGIGDPPISIGVSSDIPYEVFWRGYSTGDSEGLYARKDAKIATVKDLKGKKIATTVSSTAHYALLTTLKLNGLTAKDVEIIDLNPQDILPAWQRGDIDAAYTWDPILSELKKDGTVLISSKDLAEQGYATGGYGVVRKEFSEKHPEIVEAYLEELIKSQKLYEEKPDEAYDILAKALQISKEEAEKQAQGILFIEPEKQLSAEFLGNSEKKGNSAKMIKSVGDFLVEQKSLNNSPNIEVYENIINTTYLENVLNK